MTKIEILECIDSTEKYLAGLREQLKEEEKCELTTTKYFINTPTTYKAGRYRATEELAEIASKNMITRNRLEAWAMQHDAEWRAEWRNNISNFAIYYDHIEQSYGTYCEQITQMLGCVYMKKETAEWIIERLNDRRIIL